MDLFPAIDLRGGRAVRLTQGDFARESDHGDPRALARRYIEAGATWIHVVDLDAARTGMPVHRELIVDIAHEAKEAGVMIQTGGGVRTAADAEALLDAGVRRVVFGTTALTDPDVCRHVAEAHPNGVAIGLDHRRGKDGRAEVAVRGWTESGGIGVDEVLASLDGAPVAALVVTAIERDGTLAGPDLDGLTSVLDLTEVPVVASGGVGSTNDLRSLSMLRGPVTQRQLSGAIVGKALVDGSMDVKEAIAACVPSG